ncbi:transposase [Paracrocinitomix mangrovi]|uniref:transposase n=1 Tax=Paracrocinitomix mangrovi TaxID=2862509 RepID=UPI001C8E73E2|nr:transposase [Paracrocinitomix mangrovi]UKN02699.1 transposase [Paracrocinitomix mangrovi]
MSSALAHYIFMHYSRYFTKPEGRAYNHWIANEKVNAFENQEVRRKMYISKGIISEDPEVLELLREGFDQFKLNTAKRILNEHSKNVFLNYCPKCGGLARTPKARQCRHCGHKWHDQVVGQIITHEFLSTSEKGLILDCQIFKGEVEIGDWIEFYEFDLNEKGLVEHVGVVNLEPSKDGVNRQVIRISGLSDFAESLLLANQYSKLLEVLREKTDANKLAKAK